jgi:DNA-binding response OmpR family regulator/nitrogen-specific signal transduction histidine kinase
VKFKHALELKSLEKQKTEEIHQAKLRFFTNIAHEFCNSLTLIYGPSEQLLKGRNLDFQSKKYVGTIRSNAERMQTLIQQLMEFRKAETGFLELRIEKVDITELVRYTADHFSNMAEQKKIQFRIKSDNEPEYWPTDRSCMEKIFFNLLSNAFKYTPDNGYVHIETYRSNDNLQITITNSGKGVREEDRKIIFNRFKILDQVESDISRGYQIRTGIGLALCNSLVELLKGSIRVDSEINQYTSFVINLPLPETIINDSPALPTEEKKPEFFHIGNQAINIYAGLNHPIARRENTSDQRQKPAILIIEDDKEIRELLIDILCDKYSILQAENGLEGIEAVQTGRVDLVICDILMPKMNGVEFVRKLKKIDTATHIPVIFLSSETSVDKQIEGLEVGADAYIGKPFHTHYLVTTIERLLNTRQDLRKYYNSPVSSIESFEGKEVQKEDKEFILRLTRYISDNLDNENLNIGMLSSEMGISKMQLYRKIKELKGQTPTEFIRRIRLKQVEKLLKISNKTVLEIMYSCGFNSKAYFYQEFAKQYGMTPKEYRDQSVKDGNHALSS